MKTALKFAAWFVGALVVLSLILSVAVLILVDPNDYRGEIEAAVEQQTGRNLNIEGELSLNVFPCCGIELGPLALSNPPDFETERFARVESAAVSLQLLPLLFSQELRVGDVELDGLDLELISRADGTVNWELGAAVDETAPDDTTSTASSALNLDIAGVSVSNGRLTYRDEATGELIEVSDIQLTTDSIVTGETFELRASLSATGLAPDLTVGVDVRTEAVIDPDLVVDLANLALDVYLDGPDLPQQSATVRSQVGSVQGVGAEQIQLRDLQAEIQTGGVLTLKVTGNGVVTDGVPNLNGALTIEPLSVRGLLRSMNEPIPVTSDPDVLEQFDWRSDWQLNDDQAALENIAFTLDDSNVVGWLRVASIEQQQFSFDLQFDTLNLDRYLAPDDEATGDAATTNTDDDALDLPVDDLRALNLDGRLGITNLTAMDAKLSNLDATVTARNGLLTLKPITAVLYQGSYAGDMQLDVRGNVPNMQVAQTLTGIQLDGLLKDTADETNLAGIADATIQGTSSGERISELIENLAGDASLKMADGKYLGVDLWYEIRKARALLKREEAPPEPAEPYTDISNISATATFNDGVLRNNDFRADVPFLKLTGGGTVNMLQETLDYRLKANVISRPEFGDGRDLGDLKGLVLPIELKGPLDAPDVKVDVSKLAVNVGKQKLTDRLQKKLDDAEAKEGEEESTKDQLKRGLLKKLLN